jgi:hypothetical protein
MRKDKSLRRAAKRLKARYGPRGGASDRRPEAVREDRGGARRLVRIIRERGQ